MKTTIALFSLALSSFALAADPNLIWPLTKVRSGYKQVKGQDAFKVRVSVDDGKMHLADGKNTLIMDGETFRRAQSLSEAVLQVESGQDRGADPETVAFGTAFHVGGNYIMTNRHVLSPAQTNWTKCNGLTATSTKGVTYECFQVVYCEPTPVCSNKDDANEVSFASLMKEASSCPRSQDMCLIEMKTQRSHPFADIPSVRLRGSDLDKNPLSAYATIGNSGNFGLHFSESRGFRFVNAWRLGVKTQAFPGNSGGPLFNDQNEAVGLVYSRNNTSETFAISMEWALDRLKEKLGETHPAWQAMLPNIR